MENKLNVAVLFGGCSSEYAISLESAHGVLTHLDRSRYTPVPVGITPKGDWFAFRGDPEAIAEDTWYNPTDCIPAAISPNRTSHKLLLFHPDRVEEIPLDAVFPVLHGKNGEDGTVQGLIELAGIPLVGCGTLASALGMDKDRAHILASAAGITVPASFVLGKGDLDADRIFAQADGIGYPLFVKPVKAGSSYGISKVSSRSELPDAIHLAFTYDDEVIVEECISGFEVGCAVMGNTDLIVGEVDEIEISGGFFDYKEKYERLSSTIYVPARIPPEKSKALKNAAKTIYRALGCRGFTRVDMFLTESGDIVFNEVNTIPGFTAQSRFPSMMKAAGISLEDVLSQVIELAVRK
jgi:D-alanine---D-serine ligase